MPASNSMAAHISVDEMREDAKPAPDKLEQCEAAVAKLRDHEMTLADLEARVKEVKTAIYEIKNKTLVDLFDEAGINNCGVPAKDNAPPFMVTLGDFYHANIPDDKEDEAFAYLNRTGHGDLIKTTFTVAFGLGESKATERFARSLEKADIEYSAKRGVPWNTLSAWFKAEHKRKPLPAKAMELLGASVARVAKVVKPKREK